MSPFRIAVLASGTGTNLQAIIDRLHGREGIEVACVLSNNPGATALDRARRAGVETAVFRREDHPDRAARDAAMADFLDERGIDLVVLAGYMELLSAEFVCRFRNRIVNVHPALLPSFPGLDPIGIDGGGRLPDDVAEQHLGGRDIPAKRLGQQFAAQPGHVRLRDTFE